jgi:hypothetical protein
MTIDVLTWCIAHCATGLVGKIGRRTVISRLEPVGVNNLSSVIYTDRSVKLAHRPVGVNNLSASLSAPTGRCK